MMISIAILRATLWQGMVIIVVRLQLYGKICWSTLCAYNSLLTFLQVCWSALSAYNSLVVLISIVCLQLSGNVWWSALSAYNSLARYGDQRCPLTTLWQGMVISIVLLQLSGNVYWSALSTYNSLAMYTNQRCSLTTTTLTMYADQGCPHRAFCPHTVPKAMRDCIVYTGNEM
jgi:hypothetical protein